MIACSRVPHTVYSVLAVAPALLRRISVRGVMLSSSCAPTSALAAKHAVTSSAAAVSKNPSVSHPSQLGSAACPSVERTGR